MSYQRVSLGHGVHILDEILTLRAQGDAQVHMAQVDGDDPRAWRWQGYGATVDAVYETVAVSQVGDTANSLLRTLAHEECRLENSRPHTWMHLMEREGSRSAIKDLRAIVLAP